MADNPDVVIYLDNGKLSHIEPNIITKKGGEEVHWKIYPSNIKDVEIKFPGNLPFPAAGWPGKKKTHKVKIKDKLKNPNFKKGQQLDYKYEVTVGTDTIDPIIRVN